MQHPATPASGPRTAAPSAARTADRTADRTAARTALLRDLAQRSLPHGSHPGTAHPGTAPLQATLAEVFAETVTDAAAVGFVLAHLRQPGTAQAQKARPLLWVQDRLSRRESGQPYLAGMGDPALLYLEVSRATDVLWAMEEGLRCTDLGGVVGEVWGNAPALDFTATKRLALRAEAHGVPAWLIRRAATPDLSAARERWRLASLPAAQDPDDARAPGAPVWRADLFRARWRATGQWVAHPETAGLRMEHGEASEAASDHSRVTHSRVTG